MKKTERDLETTVCEATVEVRENLKSENKVKREESVNTAKEQDATGSSEEPLYDVPRKLYNKKTKTYHEIAGEIEVYTYSDDIVARWVTPTLTNNENSITKSTDETTEDNQNPDLKELTNINIISKDNDMEKSPSQGSLHARLMKELLERFHAMKVEHNIE